MTERITWKFYISIIGFNACKSQNFEKSLNTADLSVKNQTINYSIIIKVGINWLQIEG